MGKRINDLNHVATIASTYRVAVDLPGWPEAQYRTLAELQGFFVGHNAVTIGTANGLSLGTGANAQRLSLALFGEGVAGACPGKPTAPLSNGYAGHFLNANGDWIQLFEPPLPDQTENVLKPLNDGDYIGVGETGKMVFNVTSGDRLGTANWYSGTAGVIKTDDKVEVALGVQFSDGITLLKVEEPITATMSATGDYLPLTVKVGTSEIVIHIPTYEVTP